MACTESKSIDFTMCARGVCALQSSSSQMEWNAKSDRVKGACAHSTFRIDGRWAQGIGALLCPGHEHELTAGHNFSYFTPLGNTAIKHQWLIQDFLKGVSVNYMHTGM